MRQEGDRLGPPVQDAGLTAQAGDPSNKARQMSRFVLLFDAHGITNRCHVSQVPATSPNLSSAVFGSTADRHRDTQVGSG